MDLEAVGKMKVAELKKQLEGHGLNIKGNKAELVERLIQYFENSGQETSVVESVGEDAGHILLEESDLLGDDEDEAAEDDAVGDTTEETQATAEEHNVDTAVKILSSTNDDQQTSKVQRAERLNVGLPVDKKAERAKRFGLQEVTKDDPDAKKKARAERFGTVVSPTLTKSENLEKKQSRAERFGSTLDTNISASNVASGDKLLKRRERFGIAITAPDTDSEAKKSKRAERFGLS